MAAIRVALIYGGRSGEHEVSVESARSVAAAIDPTCYELVPIRVGQDGEWIVVSPESLPAPQSQRVLPSVNPSQPGLLPLGDRSLVLAEPARAFDVAFPLVHGTYGEDGCLQGLFELADIPYVGSGVLASAVSMDKIVMKATFAAQGFPVVEAVSVDRTAWEADPSIEEGIEAHIGYPCFVKPANLGSSVGIRKVRDREELSSAIGHAAEFSGRLIVERALDVREIECGVLGNHNPAASVVGEIIPAREFYDYEAKYHDERTRFVIPAALPASISERVRAMAVDAFKAIGGEGMARVDFFLERGTDRIYLNEINTIPGFTAMSVYPRLWAASGVAYPELISRLIELAIERHADRARNRTRYV